jgi:hypothetical protein
MGGKEEVILVCVGDWVEWMRPFKRLGLPFPITCESPTHYLVLVPPPENQVEMSDAERGHKFVTFTWHWYVYHKLDIPRNNCHVKSAI